MWCCSQQVTATVTRQRLRPRFNASAQLAFHKANRRLQMTLTDAVRLWKHTNSEFALKLLPPAVTFMRLMKRFVRNFVYLQWKNYQNQWKTLKKLVKYIEKLGNLKCNSAIYTWKRNIHLREMHKNAQKRKITTIISAFRQKIAIDQRNFLTFWRKMSRNNRLFDVEAQNLATIKLKIALKSVLRRNLLVNLKKKPSVFWSIRIFNRFLLKNHRNLLGKSVQIWKNTIDSEKNTHKIELNRHLTALILHKKGNLRRLCKESITQWKQIVPKLSFFRVNGRIIRDKMQGNPQKPVILRHFEVTPVAKITILTRKIPVFSSISHLLKCELVQNQAEICENEDKNAKIIRFFRVFSRYFRSKQRISFYRWSEKTVSGRLSHFTSLYSSKFLFNRLQSLLKTRFSSSFRALKLPIIIKNTLKALKTLKKREKYSIQRRFFAWFCISHNIKSNHSIGISRIELILKNALKNTIFDPFQTNLMTLMREKREISKVNRVFLRSFRGFFRLWHRKTIEFGLINIEKTLGNRRLKVLFSNFERKIKSEILLKLKRNSENRHKKEKFLLKISRIANQEIKRKILRNLRLKTRILSKIMLGNRILGRLNRRKMSDFMVNLKRFARLKRVS